MPSKPKIHSKLNNSEGKMKNEQALKYRNLFERAAGFPLFLDGIEATCSQESNAAFLYMLSFICRTNICRTKMNRRHLNTGTTISSGIYP